ncbi:MAG: chemotaxis protein CheW [Xanthomonadales bacterium]|nr:chemotaxis protein CheW [Xanthomonadales bacterium]
MQEGSALNNSFRKLMEYHQRSLDFEKTGPAEQKQTTNWSGVIFRSGDYRLICGIDEINEILDIPSITPVPLSQPWLLGLANVRGNLISVCDYMWFLTGVRSPIANHSRLLLTDVTGHSVALLVDEIFGQRHLNTKNSSTSKTYKKTPLSSCVSNEYMASDEVWGVLDMRRLLANPKFTTGSIK